MGGCGREWVDVGVRGQETVRLCLSAWVCMALCLLEGAMLSTNVGVCLRVPVYPNAHDGACLRLCIRQ